MRARVGAVEHPPVAAAAHDRHLAREEGLEDTSKLCAQFCVAEVDRHR
jgi:hypothetical protein